MNIQETLDSAIIGQSPITGRVYIGIKGKDGAFNVKSDFTDRLLEFAPQLMKKGELK